MKKLDRPSVIDVISERTSNGSRPKSRTDAYKLGLVIEGGGMRGVVAGGMISALETLNLTDVFDAVYGTSAGAIIGAYFVTGQARLGTSIYYENINNNYFIDIRRLFTGKPILSLEFLLDHVCIYEKPLAVDRILDGPVPLIATATSIKDKSAHGLSHFLDSRELFQALRCSARIPWVAGEPVQFRGAHYVDGSVTQTVPYRLAADDGCTHALVLRTKPMGTQLPPPGLVERYVIARWLNNRQSGLGDKYLHRIETRADETDLFSAQDSQNESNTSVCMVEVAPESTSIGPLEKRRSVLFDGATAGVWAIYKIFGCELTNAASVLWTADQQSTNK